MYLYEQGCARKDKARARRREFLIVTLAVLVVVAASGNDQPRAQDEPRTPSGLELVRQYRGQTVWDLPTIPEERLDIGLWALIVAKECDSTVNIPFYLAVLDSMASTIKYMVGPCDLDMVKFAMTKMYLYDTGTWNNGKIFSYDLDDPLGEKPGAKLLTDYLDRRLGNCVTMPTLFLALMERVDASVPFRAVLAPMHIYCRLRDRQDGAVWNIEPTNGGHSMRDEWVVETFQIPSSAIDSGSYLRELSKLEFAAQLLSIPISRLRDAGDYTRALWLAEIQIGINPRCLSGLINKAALLAWLGYNLQQEIVQSGRKPTSEEVAVLERYQIESETLVQRARALGWREETTESREQYLQTVAAAKRERR